MLRIRWIMFNEMNYFIADFHLELVQIKALLATNNLWDSANLPQNRPFRTTNSIELTDVMASDIKADSLLVGKCNQQDKWRREKDTKSQHRLINFVNLKVVDVVVLFISSLRHSPSAVSRQTIEQAGQARKVRSQGVRRAERERENEASICIITASTGTTVETYFNLCGYLNADRAKLEARK